MSRDYKQENGTQDAATNSKSSEVSERNGKGGNRNRRKGHSGSSRSKRSSNAKETRQDRTPGKSTNDPSFYNRNPELVNNVANVPFVNSLGVPVTTYDVEDNAETFYQPGIMLFNIVPTIGQSKDSFSALNRMVTMQWTFLRSAISGARSYEPSDIGIYYTAMANINSYIKYLERAYGVMNWVSARNRYLPESMVTAMGFDYADLRANLNQFRYQINMLKMSLASLVIPKDMPIFDRQAMLFEHVYAESTSPLAQMYIMRPLGFYKFGYNDSDGRPQLEFNKLPFMDEVCAIHEIGSYNLHGTNSLLTVAKAVEFGEDLIRALVTDEWVNTISGDMLKAYGTNVVTYTMMPEDYVTPITMDIAFLQQICNARALNPFTSTGIVLRDLDIVEEFISAEEGSYLSCNPHCIIKDGETGYPDFMADLSPSARMKPVVRLTVDSVAPLNLMYVTRLTNGFTLDDIDEMGVITPHFGAELLVSVDYMAAPKHGTEIRFNRYPMISEIAYSSTVCQITQFTFGPVVTVVSQSPDGRLVLDGFLQNVDNFALLDYDTLDNMNDVALMSLLDVPVISLIK